MFDGHFYYTFSVDYFFENMAASNIIEFDSLVKSHFVSDIEQNQTFYEFIKFKLGKTRG